MLQRQVDLGCASASVFCVPQVIVPRHNSDTARSVRPRVKRCIWPPVLPGPHPSRQARDGKGRRAAPLPGTGPAPSAIPDAGWVR